MRHRGSLLVIALVLVLGGASIAQTKKDEEQRMRGRALQKSEAQKDRAGGTHDKSNIAMFFENRGKLYPATIAQGVSGEWPIRSGHEYIYRANPIVARLGNVIAGRFRTSEEWEAAAGYKNPDSAKIAFSDNTTTWPPTGWIVRDAAGQPAIVSDQDSYAVYNDSTNRKQVLNIEVHQIGYAFGSKQMRDMIFYTYKVINRSTVTYDSLWFGMYVDIDVGDVSGGVQEYADDRIGFDKDLQLVYFYDDGVSTEWPGANTGYFGLAMISTPTEGGSSKGITDLHYNLYDDDAPLETDSVHFGVLSSAASLQASALGPRYFHLGANPTSLHFDDFSTIPVSGLDLVSNIASGPYTINPGDTLTFVTAFVAGNTLQEISANTQKARALHAANFISARPPVTPRVTVTPGDKSVRISWDNRSELSRDFGSGQLDFEGYRLYKSFDRGLRWDQIDRNQFPLAGADPVPLEQFDKINGIGEDAGLQYSYLDSTVVNGFEYWYTVTAFDRGDSSTPSLESPRGSSVSAENLGIAVPRTSAVGRAPVAATPAVQTGTGSARVRFSILPGDFSQLASTTHEVLFAPTVDLRQGNPRPVITVEVDSSGPTTAHTFALTFLSPTQYRIRDMQTGTVVGSGTYASGVSILFAGLRLTLTDTSSVADDRPEEGDSLWVLPGIRITSGGGQVLSLQPFTYGTWYTTANGIIVSIELEDAAQSSRVAYRDRFSFSTVAAVVDPVREANELNAIKVVPNPYLVSSLYEEEFGTRGTRREPIRQLKFNHLPSRCTIYVFTVDGDQVARLEHDGTDGTYTWNMRSAGNREIAPGMYVYLVKTATAEHLGRFAVIK